MGKTSGNVVGCSRMKKKVGYSRGTAHRAENRAMDKNNMDTIFFSGLRHSIVLCLSYFSNFYIAVAVYRVRF